MPISKKKITKVNFTCLLVFKITRTDLISLIGYSIYIYTLERVITIFLMKQNN